MVQIGGQFLKIDRQNIGVEPWNFGTLNSIQTFHNINFSGHLDKKNYETYNNERKEQVFASDSQFLIEKVRKHVTYSK